MYIKNNYAEIYKFINIKIKGYRYKTNVCNKPGSLEKVFAGGIQTMKTYFEGKKIQ